jgi:Regulated-SNARE-like domain
MHHVSPLTPTPGTLHAAFLCVADEAYGRVMPAAFLDKLAETWAAEVGEKVPQSLQEGQLTSSFG